MVQHQARKGGGSGVPWCSRGAGHCLLELGLEELELCEVCVWEGWSGAKAAKAPWAIFLHPYIVMQKAFGWVSWKIWALTDLKILLHASGYFCHQIQSWLGIGMNPILPSIGLYHCYVFCLVHLNRKPTLGIYTLLRNKTSTANSPFYLYKSRATKVRSI